MRSPIKFCLLLGLSIVLADVSCSFAGPIFGSNLIVNGNAESGSGAADALTTTSVPGWTVTSNFTAVQYNASAGFPTSSSPGPSNRGTNFFSGGPNNASSRATQSIDVSSAAGVIDAGAVNFNLSGWLGGYATQGDDAVLTITFLSAGKVTLGTAALGPVSVTDRSGISGMLARSANGLLPIGTREIDVALQMTRAAGTYNDGYADNLSLNLSTTPEPSTMVLLCSGLSGLLYTVYRRQKTK